MALLTFSENFKSLEKFLLLFHMYCCFYKVIVLETLRYAYIYIHIHYLPISNWTLLILHLLLFVVLSQKYTGDGQQI